MTALFWRSLSVGINKGEVVGDLEADILLNSVGLDVGDTGETVGEQNVSQVCGHSSITSSNAHLSSLLLETHTQSLYL